MKRLYLAFGLVVLVLGAAHAADQTLKLVVGQPGSIELESNPSTGYSWAIDVPESANLSILRIDDRGVSQHPDGRMGAPGEHRWSVQATSPGKASVSFVYRRPWEATVARRHQVDIDAAAR